MANRGLKVARAEEMRAVLAKWERSDLPLSRFAMREGIAVKTLYRWRRRLGVGDDRVRRGRPPVSAKAQGAPSSPPLFTEVSVATREALPSASTRFEVLLGNGMMVRVPEQFDENALGTLIRTLRSC